MDNNDQFDPNYDDDDDYVHPDVEDANLNLHQLGVDPAQVNLPEDQDAAGSPPDPQPAALPLANPPAQVVQFAGIQPQVVGPQPHIGGPAPNIAAPLGNVPPQPQPQPRVAGNHPSPAVRYGPSTIITMRIGNTDPSTSSGAQLINRFLENPFEKRITNSTANHTTLMAAIKHRFQQFGVNVSRIPTQGTGTTPNFHIGHHPNMDLSDYVDILDPKSSRLSLDQIMAYASWFNNDNTGLLSLRGPNDMIQRYVDPYTQDNYGRVSEHKIHLRREDAAAFALITNIFTVDEMERMSLYESKYKFAIEGSPNNFHYSGLTLLGISIHDASPSEQLDSETLRNEFNAITLESCGNNIKDFKAKLDIKAKEIQAIERTPFDQRHYANHYFEQLGKWPQFEWRHEYLTQRGLYRSGRSLLDCHEALLKVYNDLVHKKTWTDIPLDANKQIAFLTTQLQQLKDDNIKLQSSVKTSTSTDDSNNIAPEKSIGVPNWQRTYTGPTIAHPIKTNRYGGQLLLTWCPKCGPGRSAGTPSGMYMEPFNGKPHNHAEWLEAKLAKSSRQLSKRTTAELTTTDTQSFTPTNENKKRLKIRERIVQSLTTKVSLSLEEAENIADAAITSPTHFTN